MAAKKPTHRVVCAQAHLIMQPSTTARIHQYLTGDAGVQVGLETQVINLFDLWLDCGHLVAAVAGWYPVRVPCCDRPGGTIMHGQYVPYAADVDFVQLGNWYLGGVGAAGRRSMR